MDPNVWTFNSDAKNMYGDIGIEDRLKIIKDYIRLFSGEYNGHFPSKLIIKVLYLVMSKSIFTFGST